MGRSQEVVELGRAMYMMVEGKPAIEYLVFHIHPWSCHLPLLCHTTSPWMSVLVPVNRNLHTLATELQVI